MKPQFFLQSYRILEDRLGNNLQSLNLELDILGQINQDYWVMKEILVKINQDYQELCSLIDIFTTELISSLPPYE